MKQLAVTLTAAAERDIVDIATYIALDSPHAARQFEDEFWESAERMSAFPDAGRKLHSSAGILRAVRVSRRFRRYFIFARAVGDAELEIVRILHGARDLTALFGGSE